MENEIIKCKQWKRYEIYCKYVDLLIMKSNISIIVITSNSNWHPTYVITRWMIYVHCLKDQETNPNTMRL